MKLKFFFVCVLFSFLYSMSFSFPAEQENDRQQIIEHIDNIFKAFIRQDAETIRALHTEDWTGFQNQSREIVKGVDGYMKNVLNGFRAVKMLEYEIEDIEIRFYGDTAIVYYIAHFKNLMKSNGVMVKFRVRSVDVFRKSENKWNQAGSHLSILPSTSGGTPGDRLKCFDMEIISKK